jgi:hypothetical protein
VLLTIAGGILLYTRTARDYYNPDR